MNTIDIYIFLKDFGMLILLSVVVIILLLNPRILLLLFRSFIVDTKQETSPDIESKIMNIQKQIDDINAQKTTPMSDEAKKELKTKLDTELYSYIPSIVEKHLERLSKNKEPLVNYFEREASRAAYTYMENVSFTDLVDSAIYREAWEGREKNTKEFNTLVDKQLNTANSIKLVMMNLFVLFNFLIIASFFVVPSRFSDKASLTILGVYISLSAFIIFIYRASNSRSAALLAIKEDSKKFYDVFQFIKQFKKGASFSNNDVEIIKSILINRLEREKTTDHPYEVILKGVSNTNVMFKGGKIAGGKKE